MTGQSGGTGGAGAPGPTQNTEFGRKTESAFSIAFMVILLIVFAFGIISAIFNLE